MFVFMVVAIVKGAIAPLQISYWLHCRGVGALFGKPISGGSMNPGRLLVAMNFQYHWICWLSPIIGAVVAFYMI